MTVTVIKRYFKKQAPTIITYRNYSKIDVSIFRENFKLKLEDHKVTGKTTYDDFKECFLAQVEIYAPLKRKTVRANNSPFMNKGLSKAIMIRSRLKNKYNRNPSIENKNAYKKQTNIVSNIVSNC